MQREVLEFIEQSNTVTSRPALFALLVAQVAKLGFEFVTYSDLRAPPWASRTFLMSNMSSESREDYAHRRIRDRVTIETRTANRPVIWTESARRSKDADFLNWMRDHSLLRGVNIPLHEAFGSSMAVGVASRHEKTIPPQIVRAIGAIAVQFHFRFQFFEVSSRRLPTLTTRETEILRWCAAGKSNWDIGAIMLISEHTVDFHLRNAYRKLGASDRVAAVLMAFKLGLIASPF